MGRFVDLVGVIGQQNYRMKDGCFFSCLGREKRWDCEQEMVVNPAKKKCISLVSREQSPKNDSIINIQSYKKDKHFTSQKPHKQHKKALSLTRTKPNNNSSFLQQKDHNKSFLQLSNPQIYINQAMNNTLNLTNISKKTVIFLQQNAPLGHSILHKHQGRNKESSSLFRGAKTIIKKLQSSQDFSSLDTDFTINQFSLKIAEKYQGQSQKPIKQHQNNRKSMRLGKLLGKGKYTHVYTVRDNLTGFIMSFKEIFKPKHLSAKIIQKVINRCNKLAQIKHENLVNLHFCSENIENVIILQEYFPTLAINSSIMTIQAIRIFLKQMFDAISLLHSHGLTHGQIKINHICILLDVYKLRMSYARLLDQSQEINYLKDIHDLAILAFKIVILPNQPSEAPKSEDQPQQKQQILSQILSSSSFKSIEYKNLNNLLLQLLTYSQNTPIHQQKYLHHPFFCQY